MRVEASKNRLMWVRPRSTDCFFSIEYDYTAAANDTTTWRAYVLGNPIRLVNN